MIWTGLFVRSELYSVPLVFTLSRCNPIRFVARHSAQTTRNREESFFVSDEEAK